MQGNKIKIFVSVMFVHDPFVGHCYICCLPIVSMIASFHALSSLEMGGLLHPGALAISGPAYLC
jgi:hypothetical protein